MFVFLSYSCRLFFYIYIYFKACTSAARQKLNVLTHTHTAAPWTHCNPGALGLRPHGLWFVSRPEAQASVPAHTHTTSTHTHTHMLHTYIHWNISALPQTQTHMNRRGKFIYLFIIRLFRMFQKVTLIWKGHPSRSCSAPFFDNDRRTIHNPLHIAQFINTWYFGPSGLSDLKQQFLKVWLNVSSVRT